MNNTLHLKGVLPWSCLVDENGMVGLAHISRPERFNVLGSHPGDYEGDNGGT